MWKDTAGTTPVTAVDDLVARIDDKSGNGFHATQATEASRPILKQDGNGNYYLLFDGTDDGLATSAIDFTASDEMSVFAGVTKKNTTVGALLENSVTSSTNAGTFAIFAPATTGVANISFRSRGSVLTANTAIATGVAVDTNYVVTGLGKISTDTEEIRINGSLISSVADNQGSGNFGNYALYIGRRAGSSVPFSGYIYSLIVRGALSTSDEIDKAEAWVNGKTEAY
jgi:hypothetical protein